MADPATFAPALELPLVGPAIAPGPAVPPKKPKSARMERSVQEKFALAAANERPPLETHHHVILGDAREMPEMTQPESLHLVVASPPYWTLKQYDGGAAMAGRGRTSSVT